MTVRAKAATLLAVLVFANLAIYGLKVFLS